MSSNQTQEEEQHLLKNKIEKGLIIGITSFYFLSSLISLKSCFFYYTDYIIMAYSLSILTILCLDIMMTNKILIQMKKYIGLIDSSEGKGIILLMISFVHLKTPSKIQKYACIIMLLFGIYFVVIECLYPTRNKKESSSDSKDKKEEAKDGSDENKKENEEKLDKSTEKDTEKSKSSDNPYAEPEDF